MSETGAPTARPTGHRWTPETARAARARVLGPLSLERTGTHEEDIRRGYGEVEERLVGRGWPATSPWWRETFARWYDRAVRQLVARVGRRGGKSSSLSRLAVVEALFGHHDVPPGDTGFVAIISTDRKEAVGRLRTIKTMLTALGVDWEPAEGLPLAIQLVGMPIGFRVFTASVAGVSGFTAIFVLGDEVAKWKDEDTGSNPATEVLRSVRPTLQTMQYARIVLSSSPYSILDAHHDAFERGDTDQQIVAYAPTWVANPTLSKEQLRADEPDELAFDREYGAIPQATTESSLLTELLVERVRRRPPALWDLPVEPGHRYVAYIDPATRGHAWTLVLLTRDPGRRRRVVLCREWRGTQRKPLKPGAVLREIADLLAPYGVRSLRSDQWSEDALAELAHAAGLSLLCDEPWSPTAKREAYEALRSALQAETLELHPDPQVKADLLAIHKKVTRSGVTYTLEEQNGRHADYAPPLAMACLESLAPAIEEDNPDDAELARRAKHEFLLERERRRKRDERFGRMPPTHRRMR